MYSLILFSNTGVGPETTQQAGNKVVAYSPVSVHFLPACWETGSPAMLLIRLNIVYSRDAVTSLLLLNLSVLQLTIMFIMINPPITVTIVWSIIVTNAHLHICLEK